MDHLLKRTNELNQTLTFNKDGTYTLADEKGASVFTDSDSYNRRQLAIFMEEGSTTLLAPPGPSTLEDPHYTVESRDARNFQGVISAELTNVPELADVNGRVSIKYKELAYYDPSLKSWETMLILQADFFLRKCQSLATLQVHFEAIMKALAPEMWIADTPALLEVRLADKEWVNAFGAVMQKRFMLTLPTYLGLKDAGVVLESYCEPEQHASRGCFVSMHRAQYPNKPREQTHVWLNQTHLNFLMAAEDPSRTYFMVPLLTRGFSGEREIFVSPAHYDTTADYSAASKKIREIAGKLPITISWADQEYVSPK